MADVRSRIARRFWDAHSQGWDDIRADPEIRAHNVEIIEDLVKVLPTGANVIDLGCGPGHHAVDLAGRGVAVTGVDYSGAMLHRARAKAAERSLPIDFVQADLSRELPILAAAFDGALCVSVLPVIPDPNAFLGRVRSLIRAGGHLLIEVPLPTLAVSVPARPQHPRDRAINHIKHLIARVPGIIHRYEPDELASMVRFAGLVPIETRTYPRTYTVLSQRDPCSKP